MSQYPEETIVMFGEVPMPSRVDVAKRFAALKLPGVDPRFNSRPEFVDTQAQVDREAAIGLDNV